MLCMFTHPHFYRENDAKKKNIYCHHFIMHDSFYYLFKLKLYLKNPSTFKLTLVLDDSRNINMFWLFCRRGSQNSAIESVLDIERKLVKLLQYDFGKFSICDVNCS